jgi:aryl-alcohol dehydrogenase-like predicted oxidoreductase
MDKTPFGRTGFSVSRLGFGAAPIGFLETERAASRRLLELLLDSGVNLIDTAAMYRGSEAMIGEVIGHRRSEFVLVTKCGHPVEGMPGESWSPKLIEGTVDRSLRNLRTDCLDVVLLHSCSIEVLRKGEALATLVRLRDAGKIRFAGYSGDNEAAAWAAAQPEIAVIQTSVNITDQRNIDSVLPICRAHDVGVMAKRPIANAAWKELSEQPGMYANYAKVYSERFRAMGLDLAALGFTGDPRTRWPEIALRFTLSVPGVSVAIVGTTSEASAKANLEAVRKGPLPSGAYAQLRAAFERSATVEWVGQT